MNKKFMIGILYGCVGTLITIEFLKYPGVIATYLKIPILLMVLFFLFTVFIIRFFSGISPLPKQLIWLNNKVFLPICLLLFISTFILELFKYTNFIYSTFGINHLVLIEGITLCYGTYILSSNLKTIQRLWSVFFMIFFLLAALYLYTYHFNIFYHLSANYGKDDDDNFMEWLQVAILGFGAVLSFLKFFFLLLKKQWFKGALLFVAALIFVFLAGEEISWGERLVNPPIQFTKQKGNYQGELNLHNLEGLNELTALLYIVVFIYALFSWIIKINIEKKKPKLFSSPRGRGTVSWSDILLFKGTEVLFFVPTLIFNPYADRGVIPGLPSFIDMANNLGIIPEFYKSLNLLVQWRETFEVIFYAGLVLHVLNLWLIQLSQYAWIKKLLNQLSIFIRRKKDNKLMVPETLTQKVT